MSIGVKSFYCFLFDIHLLLRRDLTGCGECALVTAPFDGYGLRSIFEGSMRDIRIRRDNGGFTIIEVTVALLITLIVLRVALGGLASSLRIGHDTSAWGRAISRAESHMASIIDPSLIRRIA